jgi:predicted MFS family arabinose efflux permease
MPTSRTSPFLLPTLVFVATVASLVTTLGAPLVPTRAHDLDVSLEAAQWMLTAPLLVGSVVTPIIGRVGDGPKRTWAILIVLGLVALGAVIGAVTTSFPLLIAARALQGTGLGLVSLAISAARESMPRERLRGAVWVISLSTSVGAGLGYPITGLLAQSFDYHAAFWFAAILAGVAILATWFTVPRATTMERQRLDLPGAALLSFGLVCLLLMLSQGHSMGWASSPILALGIGALAFFIAWVKLALRSDHPLVDLRLVRHPAVLTADLVAFLMGLSLYANSSLVNRFVQTPADVGYGFGAGLVLTGLLLAPVSLGSLSSSRIVPLIANRLNPGQMVALGAATCGSAFAFLAVARTSPWEIAFAVFVNGIGVGIAFAAMPGMIVSSVPAHETGSAASITLLSSFTNAGSIYPRTTGYTVTYIVGAAICFVAAAISIALSRQRAPVSPVVEMESPRAVPTHRAIRSAS